jgi:hypothetical protein
MRALASNLEASRTFAAPLSPREVQTKRRPSPAGPPLPRTTGVPRLSPLNALATPRRRPNTGLDRRR